MKVEKTYLEDEHQLRLNVEIEQDAFDKAKYLASKELSKGVKIPGFRPGKAPYNIVVQHVGEQRVINAAIEDILDEVYPDIIDDLDEELYGPGQLVDIPSLEPPVFELLVPLQFEVELGEYHSLRIPYEPPTSPQEDIDEYIKQQQLQQATVEEVDTPAAENSLVDTKITGTVADADPDDEDAQIMTNQPLPVLVKFEGDDDSKEWPFPGFSRQLLGVSPGDTLELVHEYPDDEDVSEDLRGKEVVYKVSVESIRDRALPEFDDEFVQSISEFETADDYLESIEEEWHQQTIAEYDSSYTEEILDTIAEVSTLKYSSTMLEDRVEEKMNDVRQSLEQQGFALEDYLEMQDKDEEAFREEITESVESNLQRGLLMGQILEAEDLEASPDDVTAEFQRIIDIAFEDEDDPKRKDFLNGADSLELVNSIASRMSTDVVIKYLVALAKGEDTSKFKKATEDETESAEEGTEIEEEVEVEVENEVVTEDDELVEDESVPPSESGELPEGEDVEEQD